MISFREAPSSSAFVLTNPSEKVICHTGVKRSITLACKNIHVVRFIAHEVTFSFGWVADAPEETHICFLTRSLPRTSRGYEIFLTPFFLRPFYSGGGIFNRELSLLLYLAYKHTAFDLYINRFHGAPSFVHLHNIGNVG